MRSSQNHVKPYLERHVTDFQQAYVSDALWDRDENFEFWDQKVKGQGQVG